MSSSNFYTSRESPNPDRCCYKLNENHKRKLSTGERSSSNIWNSKSDDDSLISPLKSSSEQAFKLPSLMNVFNTGFCRQNSGPLNLKLKKHKVKMGKFKMTKSGEKLSSDSKIEELAMRSKESFSKEENHKVIQHFWLGVISLMSRSNFLRSLLLYDRIGSDQAAYLARRRYRATKTIIHVVRNQSKWFHDKVTRRMRFLKKHGWRLLLFWRCYKRKKSTRLIQLFFSDFAHFRLPYIMLRFRFNAVRLQRFMRAFVEVTKSRVEVLTLKWNKLDAALRQSLVPQLLEMRKKQEQLAAINNNDDASSWKNVKIDSKVLPGLANEVNRATMMTKRLTDQMTSGAKMLHIYTTAELQGQDPPLNTASSLGLPAIRNHKKSPTKNKQASPKLNFNGKVRRKKKTSNFFEQPTAKQKERMIRNFLYEARRIYKQIVLEQQIIHEKKRVSGLSVEEVKKIMFSPVGIEKFASQCCAIDVTYEKPHFCLFIGHQAEIFHGIVENSIRREYGFHAKFSEDPYSSTN